MGQEKQAAAKGQESLRKATDTPVSYTHLDVYKRQLYTMTEILADELGKEGGPKGVRLVALSGPTHAEEVAIRCV